MTNYDHAYVTWSKASAQIASQLAAYFPKSNVGGRWADFSQNMRNTYNLLRNHPGDERSTWLKRVAAYLHVDPRTINGVLDKPLHGNKRNQTYEGELRSLLHQTQKKEAFIVCLVVNASSSLDESAKQPQPPVDC